MMPALPGPLGQSCPVLDLPWLVPPAREGAEGQQQALTRCRALRVVRLLPLTFQEPICSSSSSLSAYAKQLISPISN